MAFNIDEYYAQICLTKSLDKLANVAVTFFMFDFKAMPDQN